MVYFRNILAALAALLAGLLGPTLKMIFVPINNQKATGIAVVYGTLLEGIFSPWCWMSAAALFALFYTFSRANSRVLRVILFWVPATAFSTFGIGLLGLIVLVSYLFKPRL